LFNINCKNLNILYICQVVPIMEFQLKPIIMFGLFKKKSEKDKLYEQYQKLTKEAYSLSTSNRKLSDQKAYEADEIMKKLEKLK